MTPKKQGRPFSPIYSNFQNLLESNQGIFRLFRKAKNPGMYQAVWLSRQGEMETYQQRLQQTEESLAQKEEREKQWLEQLLKKNNEVIKLKEELAKAHSEIKIQDTYISELKEEFKHKKMTFHDHLSSQKKELQKLRTLAESMERVIKMNQAKDSKYEDQIKKQQTHLELAQQALIKLDSEYDESQKEHSLLQLKIEELENQLQHSQKYGKEYQRINHRMENELFRVTNELEEFQSRLN